MFIECLAGLKEFNQKICINGIAVIVDGMFLSSKLLSNVPISSLTKTLVYVHLAPRHGEGQPKHFDQDAILHIGKYSSLLVVRCFIFIVTANQKS